MNDVIIKECRYTQDNFFIERTIIESSYFDFPALNNSFKYQFHIVEFRPERKPSGIYKKALEMVMELSKSSITDAMKKERKKEALIQKEKEKEFQQYILQNERKLFCSHNRENGFYFFSKVYDKDGKEYPPFFSLMSYHILDERNELLFGKYTNEIKKNLNSFIFSKELNPSYQQDLFQYMHYVGYQIWEFLYLLETGCVLDKAEEHLEKKEKNHLLCNIAQKVCNLANEKDFNVDGALIKSLAKITDTTLRFYLCKLLKSFRSFIIENRIGLECPKCKTFFPYLKIKKYCSERCFRSFANKRYYKKHLNNQKPY